MRLHRGGGRVDAHARRGLGGQVIGTGIRHRRREGPTTTAMVAHRVTMIEPTLLARLMSRICRTARITTALLAAVDLPAILGLADVEHGRALRTTNRDQDLDGIIHARAPMAALLEVAPHVRLRALSPGQRPRATRRLRALHLGLQLFCGREDRLRDVGGRRNFSANATLR